MGNAALIAVLAFGVVGTFYVLSSGEARMSTDGEVVAYQHDVLARSAALAGLERAKQALAAEFDSAPAGLEGTYADVPYTVKLQRNGEEVTVESVGRSMTASGREAPFHIRATYERKTVSGGGGTVAEEAPMFLQYAMLSEEKLDLSGNIDVKVVEGNKDNRLNANVHSNTELRARGNMYVQGYGTSSGKLDVKGGAVTFDPFKETDGPAVQGGVPRVDMPEFLVTDVTNAIGSTCFTTQQQCPPNVIVSSGGNLEITNKKDVEGLNGTRDNPVYWIISGGHLNIKQNVKIPGYVVFIALDGVHINGNVTLGDTGYTGGDESSVAFYTPGDVHLNGNSNFYGQVYAGGDIRINGNADLYGSLSARGGIRGNGNADIYFRTPSPALTRIWQDDVIQYVEMTAYNEW